MSRSTGRAKFAFVQLVKRTGRTSASAFLEALIAAVPYKIHTVLTDYGIQFTFPPRYADGPPQIATKKQLRETTRNTDRLKCPDIQWFK